MRGGGQGVWGNNDQHNINNGKGERRHEEGEGEGEEGGGIVRKVLK